MNADMPVRLELEPMSGDEFVVRRAELVEDYAQDLASSRGFDGEHARKSSQELIDGLLPQGAATPGMLLFTGTAGGERVGWVWLALPRAPERPDTAWVFNVYIDAGHRGRGYGRAMMLAAESELVRRGVPRLGLNVFGDNTPAIRLYESLGFTVTSQQMAKPLPTG
ncbi:GNAT family N-acetyltransferase [Rugosimonospora africana]|uniref:GNAT family N-acetyltransferase n=1 Tax=Rugosimonospora africana TaxID=556532 RepID=UPI001945B085|nr:GNAT family N-acetyltransferase [Rugosimonospora africana]